MDKPVPKNGEPILIWANGEKRSQFWGVGKVFARVRLEENPPRPVILSSLSSCKSLEKVSFLHPLADFKRRFSWQAWQYIAKSQYVTAQERLSLFIKIYGAAGGGFDLLVPLGYISSQEELNLCMYYLDLCMVPQWYDPVVPSRIYIASHPITDARTFTHHQPRRLIEEKLPNLTNWARWSNNTLIWWVEPASAS